MRKRITAIGIAILLAVCLAGCGSGPQESAQDTDRLQIVTTIFPEYDWVKAVLGDTQDQAEITLLLDGSTDMHSYQPSAADIMKISECDLFIYAGGESDQWAEDVLQEAENPDMAVIDLLECAGSAAREEETVEGMQPEKAAPLEPAEKADGGREAPEYDEHVWLSLRNAEVFVEAIAARLSELDPGNAAVYEKNAAAYIEQLQRLDEEYSAAVEQAQVSTLLFGDRFPFRYLTEDYGLKYYAAFPGCSAETEASFETIAFLASKADELDLGTILTIEGSDQRIANTIRESTKSKDQKILVMDSLQTTSLKDAEKGVTYLSVMEEDLGVLKQALQKKQK